MVNSLLCVTGRLSGGDSEGEKTSGEEDVTMLSPALEIEQVAPSSLPAEQRTGQAAEQASPGVPEPEPEVTVVPVSVPEPLQPASPAAVLPDQPEAADTGQHKCE